LKLSLAEEDGGESKPQDLNAVSDLRLDIEINFKEAIFELKKEVDIHHLENCETCHGNGATWPITSAGCTGYNFCSRSCTITMTGFHNFS